MDDQINKNCSEVLHRFTWCDSIIVLIILAGIFTTFPAIKTLTPGKVTIFKDNQIIAEYPVNQNNTFEVNGKKGLVKIEIKNHSVSVRESSCPHQLCIRQGSISKAQNQIVCIPNHILITISAQKDIGLDAIVH